jgi:hypothetical protein
MKLPDRFELELLHETMQQIIDEGHRVSIVRTTNGHTRFDFRTQLKNAEAVESKLILPLSDKHLIGTKLQETFLMHKTLVSRVWK